MVDQPVDVTKALYGYGYPTYGPVPVEPKNSFATKQEETNPYPFSTSKSKSCSRVTVGREARRHDDLREARHQCDRVWCWNRQGRQAELEHDVRHWFHVPLTRDGAAEVKPCARRYSAQPHHGSRRYSDRRRRACNVSPSCSWEMDDWGDGWSYAPDYYPTGESIFATGSARTSAVTRVRSTTEHQRHPPCLGDGSVGQVRELLVTQLPVIWLPDPDSQISEVSSKLKGVTQSPLLNYTPEFWTLSK